jgi:glutamyl-tRNA synthetase
VLLKMIPLIRESLTTLDDCISFGAFFFMDEVTPAAEDLIAKDWMQSNRQRSLAGRMRFSPAQPDSATRDASRPCGLTSKQADLNANQVFGILRVATTGQKVSPPLFEHGDHRQ